MILSSSDLSKERAFPQEADIFISTHTPRILVSGRFISSGLGLRSINIATYNYEDAPDVGSTLRFETGTNPKWAEMRIVGCTPDTLTVGENGINWISNSYFFVLDERRIWAVFPYMDGEGTFFKGEGVEYNDHNLYTRPVPLMGGSKAKLLTRSQVVFDLDATNSYPSTTEYFDPYTGTLVQNEMYEYAWETTEGIIDNPTNPITFLTVTEPSQPIVKLTVTDTNGQSKTTERVYFVEDEPMPYDIERSQLGQTVSFTVKPEEVWPGGTSLPKYRAGQKVIVWHNPKYVYDNKPITFDGDSPLLWEGYITSFRFDTELFVGSAIVTVECETLTALLGKMFMFPVSLDATNHPITWYEYHNRLTINRACHHLLDWHTTVIETTDVIGLGDDYTRIHHAEFGNGTILSMMQSLAYTNGRFMTIDTDKYGRLRFYRDAAIVSSAERAAMPVVLTITPQDITGQYNYVVSPIPKTNTAKASGMSYAGNPYLAIAPSTSPMQFGSAVQNSQRLALNSQGEANIVAGRLLNQANEEITGLRFAMRGMGTYLDIGQLLAFAIGDPNIDGRIGIIVSVDHAPTPPMLLETSISVEMLPEGYTGVAEELEAVSPSNPAGEICRPDEAGDEEGDEDVDEEDESVRDPLAAEMLSASNGSAIHELFNGTWQPKSNVAKWLSVDYDYLKGLTATDYLSFSYTDLMVYYEATGQTITRWSKQTGAVDLSVPPPDVFAVVPGDHEMVWCHVGLLNNQIIHGIATWETIDVLGTVYNAAWCESVDGGVNWIWHPLHSDGTSFYFLGAWETIDADIHITAWSNFALRYVNVSLLSKNYSMSSLGVCDIEDILNRIYVAWPYKPLADVGLILHGRMGNPFDLDLAHIVYQHPQDGWVVAENQWESHYCSAVRLSGTSTTSPIFDAVKAFF